MCHELFHAKFLHVRCDFVFVFAQIPEKCCNSFFERVQGRRLFSFHDGIAAAHLFRVSCGGGPRRDGQCVSGFVGITLRVGHETVTEIGYFVHGVAVSRVIRPDERPLGILHPEGALCDQLGVSRLDDVGVVHHRL